MILSYVVGSGVVYVVAGEIGADLAEVREMVAEVSDERVIVIEA